MNLQKLTKIKKHVNLFTLRLSYTDNYVRVSELVEAAARAAKIKVSEIKMEQYNEYGEGEEQTVIEFYYEKEETDEQLAKRVSFQELEEIRRFIVTLGEFNILIREKEDYKKLYEKVLSKNKRIAAEWQKQRDVIVGFLPHGNGARKVNEIVNNY